MKLLLNKYGTRLMQIIREDIKKRGKSDDCPVWVDSIEGDLPKRLRNYRYGDESQQCEVCMALFPKCTGFRDDIPQGDPERYTGCPCHKYSRRHMLRKIDAVLRGEAEV